MMIKWIDAELVRWGDYMRETNNLGYPTSSVEYRMSQGGIGGRSGQSSDGFVPGDVERTETAVLTLPHELQAAVNVVYTSPRATKEAYAKRLTRQLGRKVSRDRLNKLLDQSHTRLAGVFDGMKINRY